jgi:hypothetical protein
MKKANLVRILLLYLLCAWIAVAGCGISCCWSDCRAKFKRSERLSAPIQTAETIAVKTGVGSITVNGSDITDCDIIATITAKAPTTEEAEQLAAETKIRVEPSGDTLNIKVDKPSVRNRCIIVDFEITAPRQISLHCETGVGDVKVSDISGRIKASAGVGSITCSQVMPQIELEVGVGSIKVGCCDTVDVPCDANLKTGVGDIKFTCPSQLSAKVKASADVGSLRTNVPITLTGNIGGWPVGKSLTGTIGTGTGRLHLKAGVGSIKIE